MVKGFFKWVAKFFGYPLLSEKRINGLSASAQIEGAQEFRDLLGVARKMSFPVLLTISVNGVNSDVLLSGPRGRQVQEYLYNFSCGSVISMQVEEGIDPGAGFEDLWERIYKQGRP